MGKLDVSFLVKVTVVVAIFSLAKLKVAVLLALGLTLSYRYVVGLVFGVSPLPIMDNNTFYTNDKAVTNVMSGTPMSINGTHLSRECFTRIAKAHYKMRCRIVNIFGDFYY